MFCTTSETEGEVVHVNYIKPPPPHLFITDRSNAIVCCGYLLPVLGVRVSVTFHLTCVYIILSSA